MPTARSPGSSRTALFDLPSVGSPARRSPLSPNRLLNSTEQDSAAKRAKLEPESGYVDQYARQACASIFLELTCVPLFQHTASDDSVYLRLDASLGEMEGRVPLLFAEGEGSTNFAEEVTASNRRAERSPAVRRRFRVFIWPRSYFP